jgi:hypothetical protein
MNAHGKADDPIREVFTMGGFGVHNPAVGAAGLTGINAGQLMDLESETLTQI